MLPGYTSAFQKHVEESRTAQRQLDKLTGATPLTPKGATAAGSLPDYGVAPPLVAGGAWIDSKPIALASLRGKVVLLDFWTYSCINCLRTLPHLKAWYTAYHRDGLEIIGVHTPEFAFEHVTSNVQAAVKRLGIPYPVMQDNAYATWNAYGNQYWPAEYLIDKTGHIREADFGEGSYADTETAIRELLGTAASVPATAVSNATPTELTTPESYLGFDRLDPARYVGSKIARNMPVTYTAPTTLAQNTLAYSGRWTVQGQRIVAGSDAGLVLHFHAKNVYLVLGGKGSVSVAIPGMATTTTKVDAYKLYTLRMSGAVADALLKLRFTPGVQAYAFTFG
jgi:thiol-disulfide isomerase/thioredoxin